MFETSWQDAILMVGNLVFFVALIPSIMGNDKPAKWTSFSTALMLTIFSITYFTLSLTYAMYATALTSVGWWVLYFQKWRD